MAISVDEGSCVITIPKTDTTFVETNALTGYEVRSYDEYAFMREIADYMDNENGMVSDCGIIFRHSTAKTISGVVYARAFEILSPWTVTFENGTYQVRLVGGTNNNLLDAINPNSVSVISANSAGLQTFTSGSGLDATQNTQLTEIHTRLDLAAAKPQTYKDDNSEITNTDFTLTKTDNGNGTFTVNRT